MFLLKTLFGVAAWVLCTDIDIAMLIKNRIEYERKNHEIVSQKLKMTFTNLLAQSRCTEKELFISK